MSDLAVRKELDALTVASQIDQMKSLGQTLLKSGLLPDGIKSPEAAVTVILKGRELGIPPMQALSHIHVIKGKPTLSAELMLAMALNAGHEVWISETSDKLCTVKGVRRGSSREQTLTFTIEEAKQAGVAGSNTWKSYPAAMLRARAISAFMRMFAPDVLAGASYTAEELGAEVAMDSDGDVQVVHHADPSEPSDEPQEAEFRPAEAQEEMVTGSQVTALSIALKEAEFTSDKKEQGRDFLAFLAELDSGLESVKELTKEQAVKVLDKLGSGENGQYRTEKAKVETWVAKWAEAKAAAEFDDQFPPEVTDAAAGEVLSG